VSIEQMTGDNLLQYGVIIYVGHGGFRQPTTDGKILTTTLATGQEIGTISEAFEKKYRDKLALAIIDGSPRYSITVPWLEATTNACYSNSIVYIGACNSFRDDDLYNYFWDNGARSYLGFTYYTFYHLENEDQNQAKAVLYGYLEGLSYGASSKNSFMLHPKIIQNEYPLFTALINSFTASKWKGYSNVYLTYPKPYDLKHTINKNLVTFSWSNPPSSGQYKYYVYLNGSAYESQTTRSLTLQDLAPGSYNWYVQADLYYGDQFIESFTSDEKSFTIAQASQNKPIKSMSLSTNYPGAYFSDVSLDFKYDSKGRLSSVGNGMYTFSYSGNTMTFSDNGTAQLNSSGQFSSITWYRTTVTFKYDSEGRLSSLNDSGMKINYKWSGNDLYSVTYSDGSTEMKPHFEPSSYPAPEKGVDINLMMRIFLNEIGLEGVLPDGNCFPMMASLIGKRSEHVLGLQVSDTETIDRRGFDAFSQYKGSDGKWHTLDPNTLYTNWTEGTGEFEVKGSNVPYKLESKSWNWTADSSGAVTKGIWPLVQYVASSVTGTMVVRRSSEDINYDGVVDGRDITVSFKNGQVSGSSSKKNYSITFTFGY